LIDDTPHVLSGVALFKEDYRGVARKSASIKAAGQLLGVFQEGDEIIELLRGQCFTIKLDVIMGDHKRKALEFYERLRDSVRTSRRCQPLDLVFTDGVIVAGLRKEERDGKSILAHSKKPHSQSGSLEPSLSRALVNIAKPRGTFYDPFCGLGSTLIEAYWLGHGCVGSDIDDKLLDRAKHNLGYFGYSCDLVKSAIQASPFRRTGGIATDPPYGRSSRPFGELMSVYLSLFSHAAECLKSKGRLVFLTDSRMDWRDQLKGTGMRLLRMHYIYVHKSLTRTVYIAERP